MRVQILPWRAFAPKPMPGASKLEIRRGCAVIPCPSGALQQSLHHQCSVQILRAEKLEQGCNAAAGHCFFFCLPASTWRHTLAASGLFRCCCGSCVTALLLFFCLCIGFVCARSTGSSQVTGPGRDHAALRVPAYRASTFCQTYVLDFSLLVLPFGWSLWFR